MRGRCSVPNAPVRSSSSILALFKAPRRSIHEDDDMPDFLTVSDVARDFGVSPDTVRLWTRTGALPAIRTRSGMRLIDPRDAEVLRRTRDERARTARGAA
jgi:excisionase family DNA binding protein